VLYSLCDIGLTYQTDTIARWGGEEIIILLDNTEIEKGAVLAEKLRLMLENNIELQELLSYNLTASFGITQFKDDDDMDTVINRADKAMYLSKDNSKNRVTIL